MGLRISAFLPGATISHPGMQRCQAEMISTNTKKGTDSIAECSMYIKKWGGIAGPLLNEDEMTVGYFASLPVPTSVGAST